MTIMEMNVRKFLWKDPVFVFRVFSSSLHKYAYYKAWHGSVQGKRVCLVIYFNKLNFQSFAVTLPETFCRVTKEFHINSAERKLRVKNVHFHTSLLNYSTLTQ